MFDECENDLSAYIEGLTPYFEESLTRAFKNETLAYHKEQENEMLHSLDDVIFSIGETTIELRKLQLPWVPDFRINQLRAHLGMLCLDLNLNLGSLRIEGDYEANNARLQSFLPVTHQGKIIITFRNMAAKGKVGLFIKEDSLLPENYDLVYETGGVDIRVEYYINGAQRIKAEIPGQSLEQTLGISMWDQLTQTLTELLSRQLKKVVSEFSVGELFGDMAEGLRERQRILVQSADYVADSLLCAAKDHIVQRRYQQLITPNFENTFKGNYGVEHLGSLRTCQGYVSNLSTLTRFGSWSCFNDGSRVSLFGYLTLREFKHGYKLYEANYETTMVSGGINMFIYENTIFLKFILHHHGEKYECQLDRIKIINIRDIDVDVSSLASLGWLLSRMRSWIVATFRRKILKLLEDHIQTAFIHAIDKNEYEHNILKIIENK